MGQGLVFVGDVTKEGFPFLVGSKEEGHGVSCLLGCLEWEGGDAVGFVAEGIFAVSVAVVGRVGFRVFGVDSAAVLDGWFGCSEAFSSGGGSFGLFVVVVGFGMEDRRRRRRRSSSSPLGGRSETMMLSLDRMQRLKGGGTVDRGKEMQRCDRDRCGAGWSRRAGGCHGYGWDCGVKKTRGQ